MKLPIGTKVVFNSKDDTRREKNGKTFLIIRENDVAGYPYILGTEVGTYSYYDIGASEEEVFPASKLHEVLE